MSRMKSDGVAGAAWSFSLVGAVMFVAHGNKGKKRCPMPRSADSHVRENTDSQRRGAEDAEVRKGAREEKWEPRNTPNTRKFSPRTCVLAHPTFVYFVYFVVPKPLASLC